jgi:DNA polymerase III epsilon subunit-like protein
MKDRKTHYMIDIETTGTNINTDQILEIGIVEIGYYSDAGGYWLPTGRQYHEVLHTDRKPTSEFAKKHMQGLYEKCNNTPKKDKFEISTDIRKFIHNTDDVVSFIEGGTHKQRPKFFMGWNASTFDMPFMFKNNLLVPSFYSEVNGKEELLGDAHYRVYEQSGSLQILADMTGLDRKTLVVLAMDLNPTNIKLPEGKEHDAMYDCYKQIILQNGLIKIGRMGIKK